MQKNTLIEQKNGLIACAIFLERLINCGNFSVSNYKDYRMYNLIIRKICNVIRFKCGADFAYLQRGSDKTQEKINDAIPHT